MLGQKQVITRKSLLVMLFAVIFFCASAMFSVIYAYGSGTYGGCVYGYDCPESTYTSSASTSNMGDAIDEEITITMTSTSSSAEYGTAHYTVKVVDENGNPISGARIVIQELGIDVTTNSSGIADLGELLAKDYDIEVTYNGQTYSEVLSITDSDDNQVLITLRPGTTSPNLLPYILIGGVFILGIGYWLIRRRSEDTKGF